MFTALIGKPTALAIAGVVLAAMTIATGCGSKKETTTAAHQPVSPMEPDPEAEHVADWSYSGATGPAHWGQIKPAYAACSDAKQQSPIDLAPTQSTNLPAIDYGYKKSVAVSEENNGHSIESAVPAGNAVQLGGNRYQLIQFHMHAPSEHRIDGKRFSMELHFVHESKDGRATAIGLFVKPGKESGAYANLINAFPQKEGEHKDVAGIDLKKLLAPNTGSSTRYSYTGSLTTPPCTEGVKWNIYRQPIELSAGQIATFKSLYDHNNRPLQARNGRQIELGK